MGCLWIALGLFGAVTAWAAEEAPVDRPSLFPHEAEEPEPNSLWAYWRDRTKLGYGFDVEYNDNLLLEDNHKRADFLSTLESQIFFADSKGSLQYGFTQEVNANRYHRLNRNSIDWDGSAFADFDPGGLYEFKLAYKYAAVNRLVWMDDTTDFFRRNTDFQRQVKHEGTGTVLYSLNAVDKWVNSVNFSVLDDQVTDDAATDRHSLNMVSTLDREFRPTWTASGGYEFEKLDVPGNKLKSSTAHLARASLIHELSEDFELKGTFKYGLRDFHSGPSDTIATFEGSSKYPIPVNPRFNVSLGYNRTETSSYATDTIRVHGQQFTSGLEYELSPLLQLKGTAVYSTSQSSGGSSTTTGRTNRNFSTDLELRWQAMPKGAFTLSHNFSRSTTRDTTNHRILLGYEGEF